jgi:hypothetical protein
MAFPTNNLKQDAVYWPPTAEDKFGKPGFGSPQAIKCRWEDVNEEFISVDGTNAVSTAKVWIAIDLEVGGALWLGKLVDAGVLPADTDGAQIIRQFKKIPNKLATSFERKAFV